MHGLTQLAFGPFVEIGRGVERNTPDLSENRAAAFHSELRKVLRRIRQAPYRFNVLGRVETSEISRYRALIRPFTISCLERELVSPSALLRAASASFRHTERKSFDRLCSDTA
jgi:hypothetical protein